MIKFQRDILFGATLLLLIVNCLARNGPKKSRKHRPPSSRSSSDLSDNCAFYDSDFNYIEASCSLPTPYCGIDKTTGQVQGCVPTSDCPGSVISSEIVCQADKPSCCCIDDLAEDDYCNNILSSNTDIPWMRACSLPELKTLPVCQVNPISNSVWCANQFSDGAIKIRECRHFEFCGIDKNDGRLMACMHSQSCPTSSKGSDKIVCDPNSPLCCCQNVQDKEEEDEERPCNNILDWEDTSIWEQACGLPDLKPLDVCKVPPTKPTQPPLITRPPRTDPPISTKPGGSPDKTKVQLEEPKKKLKAGEIAGIVIGVLILLLIIAAVIWFCWYDKSKGRSTSGANTVPTETTMAVFRMTPPQGQQQLPQQPNAQGVLPPMQQSYNYPASQSAQFSPVGQTYQRPNTVSMPNMKY